MNLLDLNLTFLKRTSDENIENIENTKYKSDYKMQLLQNGLRVISKDGIFMSNSQDILQEMIDVFESVPQDSKNIYVLVGLEMGNLLNFFNDNCKGNIIVYEPDIEHLNYVFSNVHLYKILSSSKVSFATTKKEFYTNLDRILGTRTGVYICANEYYKKHYSDYIDEFQAYIDSIALPMYQKGESLKLNIGPGRWVCPGWRTLDCYRDADFCVDLRELDALKIDDNCIEKAFSSHCFEHIEDIHIQKVFDEIYRCLKKGGIFRFSCPDADKAIKAYQENDRGWFSWVKQAPIHEMLLNVFVSYEAMSGGPSVSENIVKNNLETMSKDDFIKWCVSLKDVSRPYIAHTNGIYFDKMKRMLEKAGFKTIVKSDYMQSSDEEFRNSKFDKYPKISLYVECIK